MTINKEKVTISDENEDFSSVEVFSKIGVGDLELLVSLLNEYGNKLLNICEKIDGYHRKNDLQDSVVIFSGIVGFISIFFFLTSYLSVSLKSLPSWFSLVLFAIFSLFVSFPVSLFVGLVVVLFFSSFFLLSSDIINIVNRNKKDLKLLLTEAKMIALRLEKIVRIGYQFQEQLAPNRMRKIEIDLRLADAESALNRYSTIQQERKPFVKYFFSL